MIRRLRFFIFLLLALVGANLARAATADGDAFVRGNEAYAAGHFAEAIEQYQGLVRDGATTAALFYNLGNAEYRAGDFGAAILNYERALVLEPHQPEAEANLRLVRDKARALELPTGRLDEIFGHTTARQLTIAAAVSFWLAAFALAGLLFARRRSGALIGLITVAVLVCAFCGYGVYFLCQSARGPMLAIVTAKKTDARLATADSSGTVLTLPPGSEIKILSTRGDWIYAALPNDLRGWIPAKNAERVRL